MDRLRYGVVVVALSILSACSTITLFTATTPEPEEAQVSESTDFEQRCNREVAVGSELLQELEQAPPPYSVGSVFKPFNRLQMLIEDMWGLAQLYEEVHPDSEVRATAARCRLAVVELRGTLERSPDLRAAIGAVELSGANALTRRYKELTLDRFTLAGVGQSPEVREKLAVLESEIEHLKQAFSRNLRGDIRYLELEDASSLSGLPQDYVESHPADADGAIRISTRYSDYQPLMDYAERNAVRRKLSFLYKNRGWPANQIVLRELLSKRHEYATLLGFDSYADLATADKMSGSGVVVAKFIDELADRAAKPARQHYRRLLARKREVDPAANEVFAWEKDYYSELLRRDYFDVDAAELRQFFGYADTRDAIFALTDRLLGLQVRPWKTSVWHADVESYELLDGQRVVGRFYLDPHPREGKFVDAGVFPVQVGVANRQLPVSALVTNFPGSEDSLARLEHHQVLAFAHEFGHVLHWLLSGHFEWAGLMDTQWDFVEAPSKMLEEWFWDPGFVRSFARTVDGYPVPMSMLEQMNRARHFGRAMTLRDQLYRSAMSFNYHHYTPDSIDLDQLMFAMTEQYSLLGQQAGTHEWASFGHLTEYSAMYYTYLWSEVISADMFAEFDRDGLFDTRLADKYRDTILAGGGSRPAGDLVEQFLGRPWNMKIFLRRMPGD